MNALIDMYGKCGALKRTHGVFDEMGERDLIDKSSLMCEKKTLAV